MKQEGSFKRKCHNLAHKINRKCNTFMLGIRYKEYLHNVYYEDGYCYCDNISERRLSCSDIEICRYKNRIQVKMIAAKRFTKFEKRKINRILKTNVEYRDVQTNYTEIIFNVNPHKM